MRSLANRPTLLALASRLPGPAAERAGIVLVVGVDAEQQLVLEAAEIEIGLAGQDVLDRPAILLIGHSAAGAVAQGGVAAGRVRGGEIAVVEAEPRVVRHREPVVQA